MTPKQQLREHIQAMHSMTPPSSWTFKRLGEWHANRHYRYSPNHYHQGVNLGPNERPPGWTTGEGAVKS